MKNVAVGSSVFNSKNKNEDINESDRNRILDVVTARFLGIRGATAVRTVRIISVFIIL